MDRDSYDAPAHGAILSAPVEISQPAGSPGLRFFAVIMAGGVLALGAFGLLLMPARHGSGIGTVVKTVAITLAALAAITAFDLWLFRLIRARRQQAMTRSAPSGTLFVARATQDAMSRPFEATGQAQRGLARAGDLYLDGRGLRFVPRRRQEDAQGILWSDVSRIRVAKRPGLALGTTLEVFSHSGARSRWSVPFGYTGLASALAGLQRGHDHLAALD